MSKLIEKTKKLVKSIEENESVDFGIDLETGSMSVNGIPFTLMEQLELVALHEEDPSMIDLIKEATLGSTKDPRDAEIERLKTEINRLKVQKDRLKFPEDFKFAEIPEEVSEVTDEEIQKIITELESTTIPEGQFIIHRIKNVAVIKISDSEGVSYLVTDGFYYANEPTPYF